MRISIGHVSRYSYSQPTKYSILALRLTPRSFQGQRVVEWRVTAPGVDAVTPFRDGLDSLRQRRGKRDALTGCGF